MLGIPLPPGGLAPLALLSGCGANVHLRCGVAASNIVQEFFRLPGNAWICFVEQGEQGRDGSLVSARQQSLSGAKADHGYRILQQLPYRRFMFSRTEPAQNTGRQRSTIGKLVLSAVA